MVLECRFCTALEHLHGSEHVVEYRDIAGVKQLYIGGVKPTDQQLEELAKEVQLLEQTSLWKLLTATVKAQAMHMGITLAKDFDQVMFAKAMLHVVGIQTSLNESVKKEYNILREAKDMASRVAKE